jgi:hypothetical protein
MEILISILIAFALMEIYAWLDPLAKRLVEQASKKLPEDRRADFTEQVTADLATLPNSLSKVFFAFRDCTLAAEAICQEVRRESFLAVADNFDSLVSQMNDANRALETAKAMAESKFRLTSAFVSIVDQSLAALRQRQQQNDADAETAINHFQAVSSPVVSKLSTIHDTFERKHAKLRGIMDRLCQPVARGIEANENIRRRALDDRPFGDDDGELLSLLNQRLQDIRNAYNEHGAESDDTFEILDFPVNLSAQVEPITDALKAAVRAVKRPR